MSNPEPAALRRQATGLISAVCDGDERAEVELAPMLYAELKRVAARLLTDEREDHTLQPTALVHEAWVRLVDVAGLGPGRDVEARRRFVALAASTMRRVLIDHARRRKAEKRGGGAYRRVTLHDSLPLLSADHDALLDLEAALDKLAAQNARLAKVAELRLFGGLSVAELAPIAGLSLTRAKEDWAFARAFLAKLLEEGR